MVEQDNTPPGWVWSNDGHSCTNDSLEALIWQDADGSWILSMGDGLYNWKVSSPEEGFCEALLP